MLGRLSFGSSFLTTFCSWRPFQEQDYLPGGQPLRFPLIGFAQAFVLFFVVRESPDSVNLVGNDDLRLLASYEGPSEASHGGSGGWPTRKEGHTNAKLNHLYARICLARACLRINLLSSAVHCKTQKARSTYMKSSSEASRSVIFSLSTLCISIYIDSSVRVLPSGLPYKSSFMDRIRRSVAATQVEDEEDLP